MERLVQYHPLKKTPRNSVNTFQCLNIVYITKLDNHGGNLNEAYNASFSNMHFLISGPDFKPTIWTKVPRTVMQYSYFSVFFFSVILGSLIKQCILFEIFLQFSLPPPHTMLKVEENSGYTRPTLFVARLISGLLYGQTREQRNKNINGTKINVQSPALYKCRQRMKTKCLIQAQ